MPARGKRKAQGTLMHFVHRGGGDHAAGARRGAAAAAAAGSAACEPATDVVSVDDDGASAAGGGGGGAGAGAAASVASDGPESAAAAAAASPAAASAAPAPVRSSSSGASSAPWKSILTGPAPPPTCAHGEPAVSRKVLKVRGVTLRAIGYAGSDCVRACAVQAGQNCGRMFWTCGRPEGLRTDRNARCNYFQWASDADRVARRAKERGPG